MAEACCCHPEVLLHQEVIFGGFLWRGSTTSDTPLPGFPVISPHIRLGKQGEERLLWAWALAMKGL
jgi:hypothetical protein